MEKIFLDCGIINNVTILKNPGRAQNFYTSLYESKIIKNQNPFFIFSPFILLELIGISLEKLLPSDRLLDEFVKIQNLKKYSEMGLLLADYYSHLLNIFHSEKILTRFDLKIKINHEMKFRDDWGKGILDQIYLNGVSHWNMQDLHHCIILEMIQALDLRNILSEDDIKEFELHQYRAAIEAHSRGYINIPFLRLISNLFSRMLPGQPKILKNFKEIGDCEIVHYALFGHEDKESRSPVKVFTNENLEAWKDRIKLALGFINFANETLIPQNNRVNPNRFLPDIKTVPGFIYRVDQFSGLLDKEFLNVREFINEFL